MYRAGYQAHERRSSGRKIKAGDRENPRKEKPKEAG
jgi:hypothetical protein